MLVRVADIARGVSGWLRHAPQLAGVAITLAAIVTIEALRVAGWVLPVPAGWVFLAVGGATLVAGRYAGIAGTLLGIFYLLHTYDLDSSVGRFVSPVHLAELAMIVGAAVLLAEVLHRRNLAWQREAAARSAAEAARLNEERFSTALRAAPIIIFNQDRDLRYTWFYSSAHDMPADKILGQLDADILKDPQDLATMLALKRWVLETGAGVRQEICLGFCGERRALDITIEPLRDMEGNITGITGAAMDVSDLQRTLESLREHELMLARAQQIANIGSWEIQVESRKVTWSDQMYRIFGLTPQQFSPGIDMLLPHIHPQDQHAIMVAILHAVRNGTPFRRELRIVRPDGTTRVLLAQAERIASQQNQPTRVIGTVLDITERKYTEEQLHALNETLEQRVAERTAVAEHRATQLRRLASQLTLAEQRERRRLAQLLHDHLQQLLVGAKFGIGIVRGQSQDSALLQSLTQVNEMLDESIKVSRSLTVELSPPILYDGGLAAALQWLAGWMHEKYDLRIDLAIDPSAEPQGEDVRVLLFQAVRELLFNIVKHAGVKQADLVMSRLNEDRVRIVVADAGSGFDASRLITSGGKGTGFGLFSIRERLEMLGGRLDVHSTPGHGTQITLLAPIRSTTEIPAAPEVHKPSRAAGRKPAARPAGAGSGKSKRIRVLLADDHKIVREGLASLLAVQREIEVVGEACDGQEAVDLAHQAHPDVVLMDVTMPRLSGVEATRRIAAELPHVRVIGLSMHTESDMAEKMQRAGALFYLSKSCDPDTVIETIRECAKHHSDGHPRVETPANGAAVE